MKKIIYIYILLIFANCNTENGSDCFKTSGRNTTVVYSLNDFSKVTFREGIMLEIKQGEENEIEITFGKNLIDNIETYIENDRLYIENQTNCNHIRNIEAAKVVLTAKNISEIRNASQFKLFSTDTLRYEALQIISEDFIEKEVNSGDVELLIHNLSFSVVSNGSSNFSITGKTTNLNINFAAGQGKFKGKNLIAQNTYVFHRGANIIEIYPVKELKGEIRSIGNIISYNKPPIVDVKEFYSGKLIFSD